MPRIPTLSARKPLDAGDEASDIKAQPQQTTSPHRIQDIERVLGNQHEYVEVRSLSEFPLAAKLANRDS